MQYSVIPAVAASLTGADIVGLAVEQRRSRGDAEHARHAAGHRQPPEVGRRRPGQAVLGLPAAQGCEPAGRRRSRSSTRASTRPRPDFGGRVARPGQPRIARGRTRPATAAATARWSPAIAAGGADRHAGVDPDAPLRLARRHRRQRRGPHARRDRRRRLDPRTTRTSTTSASPTSRSRRRRARRSSIDPLDQAVEQLWFNGVVVVAAAGNYGDRTARRAASATRRRATRS